MEKKQPDYAILSYWRTIEFFSPQKIPNFDPNNQYAPVFSIEKNDLAPWSSEHPLFKKTITTQFYKHQDRDNPTNTLSHTLYMGCYPQVNIRDIIESTFGKDEHAIDERVSGETAVFSIQVTHDGRPLFESFLLSLSAWALGRLKSPGHKDKRWLMGFDNDMERFKMLFEQAFALHPDDEEGQKIAKKNIRIGRRVTSAELLDYCNALINQLNIQHLTINTKKFYVKSITIKEKNAYKIDDSDFLNSFFINDLKKVAFAVKENKISKPLSQYLTQHIDPQKRIDVRKLNAIELYAYLSPTTYPAGCWPSKHFFPLAYAQQFSVNQIMKNSSKDSGIFSINGPPGTGKTTLLRDLIAAIIVERATKLIELASPKDAFDKTEPWHGSSIKQVTLWKPTFHGYEIIVASSNNSAVENITLEIPECNAIDSHYLNHVDYFSNIANELIGQDCWALLSSKLGNKQNRTRFREKFWREPKKTQDGAIENNEPSFLKYLLECQPSQTSWKIAKQTFQDALDIEQTIRKERELLYQQYANFIKIDAQSYITALAQTQTALCELKNNIQDAQSILDFKSKTRDEKIKWKSDFQESKPALLTIIFTLGKAYQLWIAQDLTYQQEIIVLEKEINAALENVHTLQLEEKTLIKNKKYLEDQKIQWDEQKNYFDEMQNKLGSHFPSIALLENDSSRELSSPWMDDTWFQARVNVFLEALNLHRVFIENNAAIFKDNLGICMELLTGRSQKTTETSAIRAAWNTFFFVVPVISTTFASFDRLFPQFEASSLGWLLIDEAGQATPQAAVGALWRAKRAIVVGDPLQLEPISTLPMTAQDALRQYFSIDTLWTPKRASVQILSDRTNQFGTYLLTPQKQPCWIGTPLRVHRRCNDPMFTVCNTIAYDGMMVFGTPSRPPLSITASTWIDVEGKTNNGHWIEEEGIALDELINHLTQHNINKRTIAIISPFSTIVSQLRFSRRYTDCIVGTIHTMQGKEAEVVILVLGGNPQKPGAKDWASEKPNLLNVAISRGKMRVFVIGNRKLWSEKPYFKELSYFM